jgi:hypothetical protein
MEAIDFRQDILSLQKLCEMLSIRPSETLTAFCEISGEGKDATCKEVVEQYKHLSSTFPNLRNIIIKGTQHYFERLFIIQLAS